MQVINQEFNFNNEVKVGMDICTKYLGKELILKNMYRYYGPVTMQYLPNGGVQSVYDYHLILQTASGFMATDAVCYDGKDMNAKEFILLYPDLVNTVLGE